MQARPVVIITGASSGIGRALALRFAKSGARLILGARSRPALEAVGREAASLGGNVFLVEGDVTVEEARERLITEALREYGRIDVLVNNAGRGIYGPLESIDVAELSRIFELNVLAPLRLTQLALPELKRSQGAIVMMSSIAGVVSVPRLGAYAATKFALEGISHALRSELAPVGVRVLVVRPGPVDTEFRAHATTTEGESGVRPKGAKVQAPEDVAEQTYKAVLAGKNVLETTGFVRVASAAARVAPPLFRWISGRMGARSRE